MGVLSGKQEVLRISQTLSKEQEEGKAGGNQKVLREIPYSLMFPTSTSLQNSQSRDIVKAHLIGLDASGLTGSEDLSGKTQALLVLLVALHLREDSCDIAPRRCFSQLLWTFWIFHASLPESQNMVGSKGRISKVIPHHVASRDHNEITLN